MDTPNDEQIAEITKALADGSKIEAIKVYREATGKGLKESKDFIDTLIPKLLEEDPEKYSNLKLGGGCASVLVFALLLSGVAVWVS